MKFIVNDLRFETLKCVKEFSDEVENALKEYIDNNKELSSIDHDVIYDEAYDKLYIVPLNKKILDMKVEG